MYSFNLPLLAPAYIITLSCERASFWSLNLAGVKEIFRTWMKTLLPCGFG